MNEIPKMFKNFAFPLTSRNVLWDNPKPPLTISSGFLLVLSIVKYNPFNSLVSFIDSGEQRKYNIKTSIFNKIRLANSFLSSSGAPVLPVASGKPTGIQGKLYPSLQNCQHLKDPIPPFLTNLHH